MADPIKDGGPAFPQSWRTQPQDMGTSGATLRDYFAAKAMAALISEPPFGDGSTAAVVSFGDGIKCTPLERYAHVAYRFADAMLRARENGNG